MMMYRPFIHYVAQACQIGKADKRSFACAAACVSVARNIVHITSEMKKRGLLVGAYWFVMYTTFFAIVSLVYFVLENPNSPTGSVATREEILRIAERAPHAMVLVDEAYFHFFGGTIADLIGRYPNLLLTRTFSKAYGLAGLRIGYGF